MAVKYPTQNYLNDRIAHLFIKFLTSSNATLRCYTISSNPIETSYSPAAISSDSCALSTSFSSSTDAVYSCWPEKLFVHQEGLLRFCICWVNIRSKCSICIIKSYAILNYYMDDNLRKQSRTQSSSCSSVPACSSMLSVPFMLTVSLRISCSLHRPIIILWESSYQWKNNK